MEQLRTVFFLSLLTGLLLLIGGIVGGESGILVAFIFALIMNGFSYFFSDKIVLALYRAQPADEKTSEGKRIHSLLKTVAQRMQLPLPKLFIIDEKSPNAFATGRDPQHAAVVFTRGILSLLDDHELEGVIAHELSHVKNRDILIASMAATIAGAISMLAHMAQWSAFGSRDRDGRNVIGLMIVAISVPIIAMLIQLAVSRSREFLADETAAKTLHSGKGLASALRKLEKGIHTHPFDSANEGTAHLFIANPFAGEGLLGLFRTHPSTSERVARLESFRS
ncbi:MAG: protease HtpX [Candidatus Diapherotrites archaeon]|uniref:Protease HtpX homolog n=1 Tax=Candidatus Iainarchaeum sp. TaxID=3101447 RepID=A0A8T4C5I5_9ARCH|nr:protease HtpX [Candidatus Diapherotrites archaeon]